MPLTIAQSMLLSYVLFLVFVLYFLALVIVSLFSPRKKLRFKNYHTVLRPVLRDCQFFSFKSRLVQCSGAWKLGTFLAFT